MQIYNTTKKELVEITVVDPQYGIDWAEDLIGNNCNDLDIIEMPDGAEYLAGDQKQIDWLSQYCQDYELADKSVYDTIQSVDSLHREELREQYDSFIGNVEFEDLPEVMNIFVSQVTD